MLIPCPAEGLASWPLRHLIESARIFERAISSRTRSRQKASTSRRSIAGLGEASSDPDLSMANFASQSTLRKQRQASSMSRQSTTQATIGAGQLQRLRD